MAGKIDFLDWFGVVLAETSTASQYLGNCPFCGKLKFYINSETGQWDCKVCGRSGNIPSFLEQIWHYWKELDAGEYDRLSRDRGIPSDILRNAGIVWGDGYWWVPIRSYRGGFTSLRRYSYGQKLMNPKLPITSFFGAQLLALKKYADSTIWLCEGEWDAMAMRAMLKAANVIDVAVGVPGARTFKDQWTEYLRGRSVVICFDADKAGAGGGDALREKLRDAGASRIRSLVWPASIPTKSDLRDFYIAGGTLTALEEMLVESAVSEEKHASLAPMQYEEMIQVYRQWLHLSPELEDALHVIFAVVLANGIQGDPLWMFLVSPPGGCKTEMLSSLSGDDNCIVRSTLTPRSLVSGFRMNNDSDPSLIPKLDGKILVLKDFTEILQQYHVNRDEIFSILRGAYDGTVEKNFGNGVVRRYKSHFAMIAGCTPEIYSSRTASLGERFLMFHIQRGVGFDARDSIKRALANVGKEKAMREALIDAAARFLSRDVDYDNLPQLSDTVEEALISTAQAVAMLRGSVAKDFREDRLLYRPQHEVGTRIAKQLKKLMQGLALLKKSPIILDEEWRIARKVAIDSCVGFHYDTVRAIMRRGCATAPQISVDAKIPLTTLRVHLTDLELLGVVKKSDMKVTSVGRPAVLYELTEVMWNLFTSSTLEAKKRRR